MDFAVCSMSQGLSLAPTRPVRASCRPDMHLDRPPVAPASVPAPFKNRSPLLGTRSGIVAAIRIPLPRHEDDRDAPLTGAGWSDDNCPSDGCKNKMRTFSKAVSECE